MAFENHSYLQTSNKFQIGNSFPEQWAEFCNSAGFSCKMPNRPTHFDVCPPPQIPEHEKQYFSLHPVDKNK